ncbi:hypothetical protein OEG84_23165 [Hoeflea sp. G2-23]|uniref:Uncharacterized protein n=1 Tax=Hoeflea algicola TaxID=2983763 RepID=A0ABT3ZFG5_9HYPH|nr:hypothetical protein [Hoeflea algicola]MCY0150524.1 hypothetical protein [Hoeflea algicola]
MDKITVENVNQPGKSSRVDATKYLAMCEAIETVLKNADTPMTYAQIKQAILPILPQQLFPAGATAGWWIKVVQLDLEAKGNLARTSYKPLRFHLTGSGAGD